MAIININILTTHYNYMRHGSCEENDTIKKSSWEIRILSMPMSLSVSNYLPRFQEFKYIYIQKYITGN